ncbi:hypothetical protein IGB42_03224 [Andreprevotia sp. IGB-42]|uniref:CAP domain-containing protein n=1 Tax=Andreprevotia sp. IGB-42 TaxID=2497473 RepID=UPI00135CD3C3|nr:CAP domain-containing protein [Andreprevotia sp. IGB-42]KAF0812234.1 hypothetical protein IGB42_03224 [Andreprevotia sp. IGB-42]
MTIAQPLPRRLSLQCTQLLLVPTLLALAACGGGGGGDSTAAPTPQPTSKPTLAPTGIPTAVPTGLPTGTPTTAPGANEAFAPINTASRAEVVARYQDAFLPLRATAFSWTGSTGTCNPGDTPLSYKYAEVKLLNYLRAMGGLPGNVTLSLLLSTKAQQAALMMDANGKLSHAPDASWKCYSADGAEAAGRANLGLSSGTLNAGIGGMGMYITDGGVASLGHRRWLLYSRLGEVGVGDTPRANALYVIGGKAAPAPTLANGVPWPPAGYVPQDSSLALPTLPWSFSYPGADFSAATVALTDDTNTAIALTSVGQLDNGYGDNTLSWTISPGATGWNRYPADTRLNVLISNVKIAGVAKNFSYGVTFIKP